MYFYQFMHNRAVWVAILSWLIAQLIKLISTFITEKKVDFSRMYGSGGMPSSHTSLVMAMVVSVGKQAGFHSPVFAVGLILAFIVMYDAAGVRRATGKQAAIINVLMNQAKMPIEEQLKELLGHTPLQVMAGAGLGILIGAWLG